MGRDRRRRVDSARCASPYRACEPFDGVAHLEHVDVSAFHEKATYVRADRADGYPPLRIASGWVNGFTDRDEAIAAGGPGLVVWQSDERAPLWGLWMRENSARDGGTVTDRRAAQQRSGLPGLRRSDAVDQRLRHLLLTAPAAVVAQLEVDWYSPPSSPATSSASSASSAHRSPTTACMSGLSSTSAR